MASKHKGAEHHIKAAEHHEQAARHHREAAKQYEAGAHDKGAHHAHIAYGHTTHARQHAQEAGKAHADVTPGNPDALRRPSQAQPHQGSRADGSCWGLPSAMLCWRRELNHGTRGGGAVP